MKFGPPEPLQSRLLLGLAGGPLGAAVLTPPTLAPVLVVSAGLGSYTVSLEWTASNKTGSAGFGYRIYHQLDGGGYSELATTTNLSYEDEQLGFDGLHEYYITPYNDAGEGTVSNDASVTLPGESDGPTLTGWGEDADEQDIGETYVSAVNLEWTEIPGATLYDIYRAENPPPFGVGSFALLDSEALLTYRDSTVVWDGGNGPIYGYKIIATNGGASSGESNELVFAPAFIPPTSTPRSLEDGSPRNTEDGSPRNLEA